MDRELSADFIRKEKNKSYLRYAAVLISIVIVFIFFYSLIKPTLDRKKIRTAVAEIGSIRAALTASGTVQPEFEQIINSPIQSKIEDVYLKAGEAVKANQKIVKL
ncbi:MAG: efflux RND transporter periplasmic adaptor subunit, partial [Calditrichaeota bacterium]|nr:efflux RND transporter periplasmic adaptor subunit [Calditrichota bacterium]